MTGRVASVVVVQIIMLVSASTGWRLQPGVEDPSVTGYVLAPDGTPVSSGRIIAQAAFASSTLPIEPTGRFRVASLRPGPIELLVSVPGLVPYRVNVAVPASRSLRLPVIRLTEGPYFRVRLVTPTGEPILAPLLHRRFFDGNGSQMFGALGDQSSDRPDADGALTIGPLPRGTMTLAVVMPLFARTRLPDVHVVDPTKDIDGGTIVVREPGAVLHVDVVDGSGRPVPSHEVRLADVRTRSPLGFLPVQTDQQGRATFDRLAAGRYRVLSSAIDWCANVKLAVSRVIPVAADGTAEMPLVIGGRARLRITSPLGPAAALLVSAAPIVPTPPPLFSSRTTAAGCRGATDAEGRVTLTNFPPGPAHVDIHRMNSTYIRQIDVPLDEREVAIAIPDGFLPVRVVNAKNEPVVGATITWTGSGGRVEASATASGDALLEGVGSAPGVLAVSANQYQSLEEQFAEPPSVIHTVTLMPLPRAARVRARVVTADDRPIAGAVVALIPSDPAVVTRVRMTDAEGVVVFDNLPPGSHELLAGAEGFVTSRVRVPTDATDGVVVTLSRGYRVVVGVELPAGAGPQQVTVINEAAVSMDDLLDAQSDRRVEPPGRLSLGPLAAGAYLIELRSGSGRRQERIRIVNRDVEATIR